MGKGEQDQVQDQDHRQDQVPAVRTAAVAGTYVDPKDHAAVKAAGYSGWRPTTNAEKAGHTLTGGTAGATTYDQSQRNTKREPRTRS